MTSMAPTLTERWPRRAACRGLTLLAALGVVALATSALPRSDARAAAVGSASDDLRPAVEQAVHVLTDPGLAGPERKARRQAALGKVMEGAIDFPEAARRALGVHWAARTPAERDEFVRLFKNLVIESYTVQLDGVGVERVVFLGESSDDGAVTVHTRADSRQQRPSVPIDYRMHRRDSQWLVYDVLVEGVSLVGNYRAQFNTVIRTKSYAELLRRMRAHATD
jgi:phospholipid transport system substrate-binding protein